MDPSGRINLSFMIGDYVNIQRKFQGDFSLNGFLVSMEESFALVHEFYDFCFVSCTIIRTQDILNIRSGACEKFHGKIIKSEQIANCNQIHSEVPLHGIPTILNSLKNDYILIECESSFSSEEDDLSIGLIKNITDYSVELATFDSLGVWHKDTTEIDFNVITKIQFNNRYVRILSKYLRTSDNTEE